MGCIAHDKPYPCPRCEEASLAAAQAGAGAEDSVTQWRVEALAAIKSVCETRKRWTTDDVWKILALPDDGRRLAGLMQKAKARGWCEPTKGYKPTTRKSRHAAPIRVWKSLIYREEAPA